ncbi:MAG: LCP family protein [Candidatus Levybacteria bacterium]|nr:LCP family protein [Candidatus Levybacteria bacterium]
MRKKKISKKKIIITVLFFLLVVYGIVLVKIPFLWQLFLKPAIELKKIEARINILVLGIGGGRHDGPLLTDTIIYAGIDSNGQKTTLVSLPRDLWIPEMKAKINTAYAYGEAKRKGGGLVLTTAIVQKILQQPVDYAVRIDFNGFIKAIDTIGGVDVNVERSFEDSEYPLSGKETDTCGFEGEEFEKRATSSAILEAFPCRFEHIQFEKGLQHLNGETALKFVRSRHAKGEEGTDFARAKRQEKVIDAFKAKIFSLGTLVNPSRIISLYDVFKESIDTNIKEDEYDDFIKLARKMENAKTNSVVFYYTPYYEKEQGMVINPPVSDAYEGQWVIIPRLGAGNYTEMQAFVKCEIEIGNCKVTPSPSKLNE